MSKFVWICILLFLGGCSQIERKNSIDLATALSNTKNGKYVLIAVPEKENFVSFQSGSDDKQQFYFDPEKREAVLKQLADAVETAKQNGHDISAHGF